MKKKVNSEKYVDITNVTGRSVSLPKYGILRPGKTVSIEAELLDTIDYRVFRNGGIIATADDMKNLPSAPEEKMPENEPIVVGKQKPQKKDLPKPYIPKSDLQGAKKASNDKSIKRVGDGDSDGIENGVEPGEEDNIQFVDIEQRKQRIAEHPALGKKLR